MHLIRIDTVSLDEGEAAVDLGQAPGDIVFLSFTDSDLVGVATAHAAEVSAYTHTARPSPDGRSASGARSGAKHETPRSVRTMAPFVMSRSCGPDRAGFRITLRYRYRRPGQGAAATFPTLRLAKLARLRHPMSVDLYVDSVIAKARMVVIRCLGGLDYWRYGIERSAAAARANGVALAVLPGDDRPDARLDAFSTVAPEVSATLDAYVRAGGAGNLRQMLRRIAAEIGCPIAARPPRPLPRGFPCCPGCGPVSWDQARDVGRSPVAERSGGAPPLALLLVYRSAILGGDGGPVAVLASELGARGIASVVVAVSSLKDPEALAPLREAIARHKPDVVVAATAFSAREDQNFVLDRADCPVIQAFTIGSSREAWRASVRGLGASDLAMQVALPEFDGRLAGCPISFKEEAPEIEGFGERRARPDAAGIAALADRAAAWVTLARTPRPERRLALVLSDYPARGGRAGFAVGLDTPASARAIAASLRHEGYAVGHLPEAEDLMRALTEGPADVAVPLAAYRAWLARLPEALRETLDARWGAPEEDPLCTDRAFRFRSRSCLSKPAPQDEGMGRRSGGLTVFLQPDRGRSADRKAGYHDPDEPPTHAYLAFHLGLRSGFDALIHLGTHGTTEWLPGKAVALSAACWPALAVGALPVVYPFIVDDPGEAAPLKRRLGGIALGHLTPQTVAAGLTPEAAALRELVEEYASASVLDPRRAAILSRTILDEAQGAGLLAGSGIDADTPMAEALAALDAHLCDLAEVTTRDGLHVFGQALPEASEAVAACALSERAGLLAALDGRFVAPGPAGSPSRGRADVMPTGRNLTTLDPRALPTRSATLLGTRAAAAVVLRYLQDEGEYPARIVMDLWASPTLRTGGEDVAHALALMGVRPTWDHASTRVTGFEVLPLAMLDRPRIDVTVRVSGAFRDTFPETLALLDRAARAVADREEEDDENPLAAARRRGESPARIYGAAPGRYGAGAGERALDGAWDHRDDLGRAYLAATTHAYGGAEDAVDDGFAGRVAKADTYVHAFDVAERDLLDGDAAVEAMGGFAAAAALAGARPALYSLDVSKPETPRARTAREDAARLIRGRLSHPAWIAAQLRHGYRGAQELAQGVDAVFVLAATTDAVAHADLDRLYGALVADAETFSRLRAANPAATRAILERFDEARTRGLWQSRRNALAADELMPEMSKVLPEAAE